MSLLRNRFGLASAAVVALTAVGGIAVWPRLPAKTAIHFSASGTPDIYVSKSVGVALLPAVMALTLLILDAAFRLDPPATPRIGGVVAVATMAFMGSIHGLVLGWNLGYAVPFDLVLVGSLVWALALVAYAVRAERRTTA
ncbi:DUF1648 domain-containing protein [Haloarcula salina]|uniref:DUF1648 domain-containing protein n=1 Tax=Haloarcula salina TaxID=1429914 RepID=A0AA41G574_9EURY|nr:DUF1648 domain-containing protein [Haloarcula salina]MBV0903826.1 DUF1648 domain-containing protein [Haloarcula salina]